MQNSSHEAVCPCSCVEPRDCSSSPNKAQRGIPDDGLSMTVPTVSTSFEQMRPVDEGSEGRGSKRAHLAHEARLDAAEDDCDPSAHSAGPRDASATLSSGQAEIVDDIVRVTQSELSSDPTATVDETPCFTPNALIAPVACTQGCTHRPTRDMEHIPDTTQLAQAPKAQTRAHRRRRVARSAQPSPNRPWDEGLSQEERDLAEAFVASLFLDANKPYDSDSDTTATPMPPTPASTSAGFSGLIFDGDSAKPFQTDCGYYEPVPAIELYDAACADKSVGSVTVAGYHYESDALSSCSDTESEFYAGREHIWDFSMYGFENPFEDPPDDESETNHAPSLPVVDQLEPDPTGFWGSDGKPRCDTSESVFEHSFVPLLQEIDASPYELAHANVDAVEIVHTLLPPFVCDFGSGVPSVEVTAPPADFATLSGHPPPELRPPQDEAWGMQLAVVGMGCTALRPSVAVGSFGGENPDDPVVPSYMLLEHGVWRKACCFRESTRLVLDWWIEEDDGQYRPARPRDIELR